MNQGNEQFPKDPLINKIINGKYSIVDLLGKGSFGTTYLAKDLSNKNSKCAVKILKDFSEPTLGNKARQYFEKEYDVLKEINHPQVPKMIDFFPDNLPGYQEESMFLVQEYIEGDNLGKEFKNNKKNGRTWNQREVIDFLIDILTILEYMQTRNISGNNLIHRDIYPANLMRHKQDGKIYLIDFGLVKLISLNYSGDLLTTVTYGNDYYCAPEQRKGKVNFCSDIYSVGLVAIEGLKGEDPLGNNWKAGEVEWGNIRYEINEKVCEILEKMVLPDPEERYQSAANVLADLEPFRMLGKTLKNNTYIIKDYLGSGKFGNTYLAEEREENKSHICVIKQLKSDNYNHKRREPKKKFKKEVDALGRLEEHNQIPEFFDYFEELGENYHQAFYLVQEYIEGEDIRQELSKKNWNENQVIDFLNQLLEILNFIHSKDVIHCDIKPSNIMRRFSDRKFVLIDFGSVKKAVIGYENVSQSSSSTQSVGTKGYESPEQAQGNEQIGCNSDIYSLGITAIQALTGKEPYKLGLRDKKTGKYHWSNNQVDDKLVRILDKMVAFDHIKSRYQSAQEVLNDLARLKGKNIFDFQSLIKRKFWVAGMIFGVVILSRGAWVYFASGSFRQNFEDGKKLINTAEQYKMLDSAQKAKESYENARRNFKTSAKLNSKDPRPWINMGYIHGQLGNLEESKSSCDKALSKAKKQKDKELAVENKALANDCIAVYFQRQQNYEEAIKYHEEAIRQFEGLNYEENPDQSIAIENLIDYARSLSNMGETLMKSGKIQEAVRKFKEAVEKVEEAVGKIQEASEDQKNQKKLDDLKKLKEKSLPLKIVFTKNLAEVLSKQGTFEESEKYYNDLIDNHALNNRLKAKILLDRARVRRELRNFDEALRDCSKLDSYVPKISKLGIRASICKLEMSSKLGNYNNSLTYEYENTLINDLNRALNDNNCASNTNKIICQELRQFKNNVTRGKLNIW
ncbi:MAG: serine/threonine protein kinase [Okeania sp. SIO2F4]|uniref:protein kinase domain-containing protein n=1 Tax=Okeania sp. SIO2F4 TaxID=2607790 RepID=UPI00142C3F4F|nr:serine/threonine-protein kinase [Okeania sp. SIO2F4]NES01505.1 serine/threonine protein kinase [Okeania sp. SIO2F4]